MKSSTTNSAHTPTDEPLTSMREFASGWDRFWFAPSDPTTIGLIRLMSGIVILYAYFCYSFDLLSYVSPREAWLDEEITNQMRTERKIISFPDDWAGRGITLTEESLVIMQTSGVPRPVLAKLSRLVGTEFETREAFVAQLNTILDPDEMGYRRIVLGNAPPRVPGQVEIGKGENSWSIFFHLEDPRWIWTAHILILFVMLLFTIGFATRITSVLAFMGAVSYIWRAPTSLFGMDAIIVVLLFYLMIAPSGAALSLDRWLEVRRERKRLRNPNADVPLQPLSTATFATRLMQINFCFIYLASGTSKLLGAAWWNGNALWACYANYSFAPMRVPLYQDFLVFLCRHRWLWELVMSFGALFTLFMELSFAYLVWNKRWRWVMLSGSVMLHTGIGLFMGLVTFSLMMLCLVLSFVPPEATRLFLARVAENWRRMLHLVYGSAPVAGKAIPAPAR